MKIDKIRLELHTENGFLWREWDSCYIPAIGTKVIVKENTNTVYSYMVDDDGVLGFDVVGVSHNENHGAVNIELGTLLCKNIDEEEELIKQFELCGWKSS